MQDWQTVLSATVAMRLDACNLMAVGSGTHNVEMYDKGRKLHSDAERIASKYRLK